MWPGDLEIILKRTKNIKNNVRFLPKISKKKVKDILMLYLFKIYGPNKRPFAVHEVIDLGGEAIRCDEYITIGRYTDMNYGKIIAQAARRQMDWRLFQWNIKGHIKDKGLKNLNFNTIAILVIWCSLVLDMAMAIWLVMMSWFLSIIMTISEN